jgi:hypothetical protein
VIYRGKSEERECQIYLCGRVRVVGVAVQMGFDVCLALLVLKDEADSLKV